MSTNSQQNPGDQEIDLTAVLRSVNKGYQNFNKSIYRAIKFVIQHIIVIGVMCLLGIGIGYYLDKTQRSYESRIIVQPNFRSTDYLYAKIDLIDSKIKEGDTVFLKSIGIQDTKKLFKIEVKPVVDVYEFVNADNINPETGKRLELLRLLSEGGDITKIVEEKTTSKNYAFHTISFKTKRKVASEKILKPLLNYLNDDAYFKKCQKEYVNNLREKMKANAVIIAQIDGILNGFSSKINNSNSSNDKLVYYNENTQLNDIIESKDKLVQEQGRLRLELVSSDKIIKENSVVLNALKKETVNGNLKFIIPFLLFLLYLGVYQFVDFYRSQSAKNDE